VNTATKALTQDMVYGMTWQRLTANRIVGIRFFCAMAKMFSLADLLTVA